MVGSSTWRMTRGERWENLVSVPGCAGFARTHHGRKESSMRSFPCAQLLILISAIAVCHAIGARPTNGARQKIAVAFVGYADRWGNFASFTDSPSVRDFLAVLSVHEDLQRATQKFVKLRFLYWPQRDSDPKVLARHPPPLTTFYARRETWCDEQFSSLSREGEVSTVDSKAPPSRFLLLQDGEIKLPSPEERLACFVVNWPTQK